MQFLLTFYKYYKYYNTAYSIYSFINDNIINDFFKNQDQKNINNIYINIYNKYTLDDIIPIYSLDNIIPKLYNTTNVDIQNKIIKDKYEDLLVNGEVEMFKLNEETAIPYKIDDKYFEEENWVLL